MKLSSYRPTFVYLGLLICFVFYCFQAEIFNKKSEKNHSKTVIFLNEKGRLN